VQVGSRNIAVDAREARGEERAQLWAKIVALNDEYRGYESRTDREIPVVVLTPS
jgi:deazaflavin-dependent oxidoreductase (nitroreductase family)